MKIINVTVECKKSYSYQTFSCSYGAEINESDDVEAVTRELQAKARKAVVEQIELEKK